MVALLASAHDLACLEAASMLHLVRGVHAPTGIGRVRA